MKYQYGVDRVETKDLNRTLEERGREGWKLVTVTSPNDVLHHWSLFFIKDDGEK